MQKFATVVCWSVLGLALVGCKDEACERQRFEVSDQWEEVTKIAARRAVNAAESGGPSEAWKNIKDQADLVESSFATPEVTWTAAQNGRTKLRALFKPFEHNEESRAFAQALVGAERALDAFEKACR